MAIEYGKKIAELMRQHGARIVPLTTDGRPYSQACQNCAGAGIVMAYMIQSGPYKSPLDGRRVKWLDAHDGKPAGWYAGELIVDTCPVCGGVGYVQNR